MRKLTSAGRVSPHCRAQISTAAPVQHVQLAFQTKQHPEALCFRASASDVGRSLVARPRCPNSDSNRGVALVFALLVAVDVC